jgi:endonuclease/exonuclease/phosphatase family metal-dependent hydrolase
MIYPGARQQRRKTATVCAFLRNSRRSLIHFAAVLLLPMVSFPQETNLLETGRAARLIDPAKTADVTVVSYNIRWRTGSELQQIADWLKAKQASLIALQEVDRAKERTRKNNNARALAEALGMHYAWAAPPLPRSTKEKDEETGVELLSSYPLRDVTRMVLPHEGPGGRWRVALGATVTIAKRDLRVYSVHSETRIPVDQKIGQFRAVLDDLKRFPKSTPAIIMGDFNSWEPATVEQVRQLFTKEDFATPFPDNESTFRRSAVIFDVELKLDWIWLRGLTSEGFGIDRRLTVSDHFPLWSVISLQRLDRLKSK